jgi:O-antigen/teichoic acid export membrane protein
MNIIKCILTTLVVIIVMFIIISIADIVLSVISRRFYSNLAFITIFGVGGIFAAIFSYSYGMAQATEKNTLSRWSVIVTIILSGLLFFFLLSSLEGGEYEPAFKAFGVSLVLGSLLAAKAKVEV